MKQRAMTKSNTAVKMAGRGKSSLFCHLIDSSWLSPSYPEVKARALARFGKTRYKEICWARGKLPGL